MRFLHIPARLHSVMLWIAAGVMAFMAHRAWGWQGVAVFFSACVLWALLQINRMLAVLRRTAHTPKGTVASAVMLNAKLKPNMRLLHLMALTKSLGTQLSAPETQPEIFQWTDAGGSSVTCEFLGGKLQHWNLHRPPPPAQQ